MANSYEEVSEEWKDLILSLPKENGFVVKYLYQYQGFWHPSYSLQSLLSCHQHFQSRDDDLLIVSPFKCGTTWLKALAFAILNRTHHEFSKHPLLTHNPHDLVPNLEFDLYSNNQTPDLTNFPSPRLLSTHVPYPLLPPSVIKSDCRVVYICRNPRDTFVSLWHFMNKLLPKTQAPLSIVEFFELFCRGVTLLGPFWDHVLVHWKESLERPHKLLFLKYEEMMEDPEFQLKRLAQFMGCPFSAEEERDGVLEEIWKLCSFESLSNLEVNKTGVTLSGIDANKYFRRGKVGDSANYLTAEMIERLDRLTEDKLQGSGLVFKEL